MIKRIFLDIDGVLNRFQMYVFHRLGFIYQMDDRLYPVQAGWDIVKAANIITGRQMSKADFWNSVTREMWATVPKSYECDWLIGHAEHFVGRKKVCLLTSPTLDPDCAAGKVEWINSFMPDWLKRQFFIGPLKEQVAAPDALLIDDSDQNVDSWRAAGGKAILIPRPWNSYHLGQEQGLNYVAQQLDLLCHTNTPIANEMTWYENEVLLSNLDHMRREAIIRAANNPSLN